MEQIAQVFLLLIGQHLQRCLGLSLDVQDSLHSSEGEGAVGQRPLQGCFHVVLVIVSPQGQDLPRLGLAVAVSLEQAPQEALADFAPLGEAPLQQFVLLTAVVRRAMLGKNLPPAHATAGKELMPTDLLQIRSVENQLLFRNPHRQHLADIPPWRRILVLPIGEEAFAIDRAVHHLRRVVRIGWERNQMGQLLGVQVDRLPLGLSMHSHVGRFRQPAGRDFIQMLQRVEGASVEQIRFHIVKRPFHLPFCFGTPGSAGDRPEAVVRGERQEAGVVDRQVRLPARHHHLHVVVEAFRRRAAQVLEGPHVLPDGRGEVLALGETQVLPARVGQQIAEQVDAATSFPREVQVVLRVIHLRLLSRRGFKPPDQGPRRLGTQHPHPVPHDGVAP